MKTQFKFSNLCGTVYSGGNLVFSPDGNSILSPVGNRVSVFDLVNNKSETLPFEMYKPIVRIALSPKATFLITIDEDGRCLLVNFVRRIVLNHFNFKHPVRDIQFSPDAKFIAVTHGNNIQIWKAPGFNREFAPFVLHRELAGHYAEVRTVNWSKDCKYLVSASNDMTLRVWPVIRKKEDTKSNMVLHGHRDKVMGAWFSDEVDYIYSIGRNNALLVHQLRTKKPGVEESEDEDMEEDEEEREPRWFLVAKHFHHKPNVHVRSCQYFAANNLAVIGFSDGIFGLWELPSFTNIHMLSITQHTIDTIAINRTGEWLAFGSSKLGQLLVWEWQSETYVLKQQSHFYDMSSVAYSPDGQTMATGGEDGKVKVWNTLSGFCFVTFSEHKSGISAVDFAKQGQVLFSASLDGTVRAFDLVRYRNFRTFTSPDPVQFTSLAVDPSGEIICAGTMDTFEIYVWSVQTGKLMDVLAGHTGPISSLAFSSTGTQLLSGSWDFTARTWDVFGRSKDIQTLQHQSEVLAVAYRPDCREAATATLDGQISFWNVEHSKQTGGIDGRKDISGGRHRLSRTTAENDASSKYFNTLAYTADGESLLAGGSSKYICLYDIASSTLVKKFVTSSNVALDGTQEKLNSKQMTEWGSKEEMESADESDIEDRIDKTLPGAQSGDLSRRSTRREARTMAVRFSPTGRAWAAATTDGLLVYSLDDMILFDPFDLEIDITPDTVMEALEEPDYLRALCMALRLNEKSVTHRVFEAIPSDTIPLVAPALPQKYLDKLLPFIGAHMETSPHIEYHLLWVNSLLSAHGAYLRSHRGEYQPVFRALHKGVCRVRDDVAKLCDNNKYTIEYLLSQQNLARS